MKELQALTQTELSWLLQELERRLTTLDSLLGGLTQEEYRRSKAKVIEECLEKIRKNRGELWEC